MGDITLSLSAAIGLAIRGLREQRGLTLEDLADRAGCHRTSISLVERGLRNLTVRTAAQIAEAFGMSASDLVALGEGQLAVGPEGNAPRPPLDRYLQNHTILNNATGLKGRWVADAILSAYETFDLIDGQLLAREVGPLSQTVELANLSSMLGNLLCAGLADASGGRYARNRPHAYPDLLAEPSSGLSGIEVKTALEKNRPKGHLPKSGFYMTFRYVLGDRSGGFTIGKEYRGDTIWIWECRVGYLAESDFDLSNTPGDSGKTAVIKTTSFKDMERVLYVPQFLPYKRRNAWYGDGEAHQRML